MQASGVARRLPSERAAEASTSLPVLRVVAIATLLGAEAIHTATMEQHWRTWAAAGVFFLGISVAEGLLAAALYVEASQRVALLAIAVSLATAAVWVVSRRWGLPFGPFAGVPESVGIGDSISTGLELLTAAALLPFLRAPDARPGERAGRAWPRAATTLAIVLVAAVLAGIGVTSAARGHTHGAAGSPPAAGVISPG